MTAAWIFTYIGAFVSVGWLFRLVDRIEGRR